MKFFILFSLRASYIALPPIWYSRVPKTRTPDSSNNSVTPWQGEKNPFLCSKGLHKVRTFPLFKGIWAVYSLLYSQANNIYKDSTIFSEEILVHTYYFLNPFPISRHFHKLGHPSVHIRPSFRDYCINKLHLISSTFLAETGRWQKNC